MTESLSAIETSSACEVTDWLRVRPRIELPIADEVTLPPPPRRERCERTADSGAEPGAELIAGCLPPLAGLLAIDPGGGDLEGSLRGLTLRAPGLVGDIFRFFVALAGNFIGVHRVSYPGFDGVDTTENRAFGIGVASSLAISNGLYPIGCCLRGPGVAILVGGGPLGNVGNAGRGGFCDIVYPTGGGGTLAAVGV